LWSSTKPRSSDRFPSGFAEQARRHSSRTAIRTRTRTLTYDELNQHANRLAWALLRTRGRGQEAVALLFEQGASAIVAMLGVLKAGRFYVPLDPAYPRARIEYMLEDSQASVLVTNDGNVSFARELASRIGCELLNVDEIASTSTGDDPDTSVSADSLAWILYTSGSTGKPKGVVQTHRNVLHDIMNYANGSHICQADRLALLASYSVVDAVRTLYGALLNGAVVCPFDVKQEGLRQLADWLGEQKVPSSVPSRRSSAISSGSSMRSRSSQACACSTCAASRCTEGTSSRTKDIFPRTAFSPTGWARPNA
jgi:non-ribosomal peptide synthetase component F